MLLYTAKVSLDVMPKTNLREDKPLNLNIMIAPFSDSIILFFYNVNIESLRLALLSGLLFVSLNKF